MARKIFVDRETRRLNNELGALQRKSGHNLLRTEIDALNLQLNPGDNATGDQNDVPGGFTVPLGFPWTTPSRGKRVIESLFPPLTIPDEEFEDFYSRHQITRRVIDAPVEEGLARDLVVSLTNPRDEKHQKEFQEKALKLYQKDKAKLLRFFKLVQLYGYSILILGHSDIKVNPSNRPKEGIRIHWLQPTPKPNVTELRTTESIPLRIRYARVSFGAETLLLNPERFIHSMKPKLTEEDKEGESFINPVFNLFTTQIHADWAIGQSLWRGAAGLLGLMAPRANLSASEKLEALAGTANINARTVLYLPAGWNLKDLIKKGGNIAIARTYKVILEQIAAGTGIPVSIYLGSGRGGLGPPDEDKATYFRFVGTLQENLMRPALQDYFRAYQKSRQLGPGDFVIEFNELEYKSRMQRKREKLEEAAIDRLLEALEDKDWMKMFEPKEIAQILNPPRRRR